MSGIFDNSISSDVLLSIITVSFNDADRLSNTIQSLASFYGDTRYEHIVVDGGSTDHTTNVVHSLADTSNFKFDSDLDEGIYDAMNKGVQRSCGRFMLFLNCGDRMLATPEELVVCLTRTDQKMFHIMCFSFEHVDNDSSRIVEPQKVNSYKLPTSHQGMVFLSEFVRTYFYDTRYKIAADYDLYLHAQSSQIILAPVARPLTAVEVHGVASGNAVVSYKEYLLIAFRNLHGMKMLICLICIGCKAMLVIPLKLLLPQSWIGKIRSKS